MSEIIVCFRKNRDTFHILERIFPGMHVPPASQQNRYTVLPVTHVDIETVIERKGDF